MVRQSTPLRYARKLTDSITSGILKLDLDKESYERAGLVGKAIRNGGRKHVKVRYGMA